MKKNAISPPPPCLRKPEYIVATRYGFYVKTSLKKARNFVRVHGPLLDLKNPTIYRVDRRLTRVA